MVTCVLPRIWEIGLLLLAPVSLAKQNSAPSQPSAPQQKNIKVYLIGDSTMSNKETKAYPETGWGMPFFYFFDATVTVDNRAKNARSTKTFSSENLLQSVMTDLKEDEYCIIQFGHNNEVKENTERHT